MPDIPAAGIGLKIPSAVYDTIRKHYYRQNTGICLRYNSVEHRDI